MNSRAIALLLLLLGCVGCGPYLPPTVVPPAQLELEPFRAALKQYLDQTQPFRKQAAERSDTAGNQARNAPEAEDAVRLRERTMAEALRTKLRPNARQGELFTPAIADYIKSLIDAAFKSPKVDLIRDELQEQNEAQEAQGAPPRINESFAAPRVPPLLQSVLPELPDQVEFDFQQRTLLLRDVDANVVIDYIVNALPEPAPPPKAPAEDATTRQTVDAQVLPVPDPRGATIFAAIGDSGSGDNAQRLVAESMLRYFTNSRRFSFVLMLGDNLYHDDYTNEFLVPYKPLLDRGVTFYATLGNHDRELQKTFKPFNMGDRNYYAFSRGNARFVALDSNQPADAAQAAWVESGFGNTGNKWRIAFFHHPLYSAGQHADQSGDVIRPSLEPVLTRNKVNVVFGGHEHLYERIAPQNGIRYFVSGGGGRSIRAFDRRPFDEVAVSAHHFMVMSIDGDRMFFEAITPEGRLIDCGLLWRTKDAEAKGPDAEAGAWLDACRSATRPAQTTNQRR